MSVVQAARLAKTTPPRSINLLPRPRLFDELDALSSYSNVWIAAPAGSGKSALIASYIKSRAINKAVWYQLDRSDSDPASFFHYLAQAAQAECATELLTLPHFGPEYLPSLPVFTRKFFEQFFSALGPASTLVIDDFQELPADALLQELLSVALSSVPENITVFVISRTQPPSSVARLQANQQLVQLNGEALRFTQDELTQLIHAEDSQIGIQSAIELNNKMEGWAAGLVLVLKQVKSDHTLLSRTQMANLFPDSVYNYFANEFFQHADSQTQEFLLRTCWFPVMNSTMAATLSGNHAAKSLLDHLVNSHFFVEKKQLEEASYQYHSLFREFLKQRSTSQFSDVELTQLKKEAASLLEKDGQFEEAIDLFLNVRAWPNIVSLILQQARSLHSQGRYKTVDHWLRHLPLEVLQTNAWLQFWQAQSQLYFHTSQARNKYIEVYERFKKEGELVGQLLSWSGIIESYFLQAFDVKPLDYWLHELDNIDLLNFSFPNQELNAKITHAVFTAMFLRRPDHPQMNQWCDRMMALLSSDLPLSSRVSIGNALLFHYIWYVGDRGKATIITKLLPNDVATRTDVAPFERTMWSSHHASYTCWFKGDLQEVYDKIEFSLHQANEHGIHYADALALIVGATASFMAGDVEKGNDYVHRSLQVLNPIRRIDLGLNHLCQAWAAWLSERLPEAGEHARLSLQILEELGTPSMQIRSHIAIAQIEAGHHNYNKAYTALAKARHLSRKLGSMNNLYVTLLIGAKLALRRGRTTACSLLLKEAFALGRRQGFYNILWFKSDVLAELCVFALEHNIESDHVYELVRILRLKPKVAPSHLKEWPWPIRIITLDGFSIEVDGKPLKSAGKAQHRPLDILKFLIASGGRNVRGDQIMEAFWPDIEEEKAYGALHTNLHRVRKLLCHENALSWDGGRITLNPFVCWVDAWAFEHFSREATRTKHHLNRSSQCDVIYMKKAIELYHAPFLISEQEDVWLIGYRQRLHNRFVRTVLDFGVQLELDENLDSALELYWRAIDIDATVESFHQRLMIVYQKQGRTYEAQTVYRQYSENLERDLGIKPSREMESIYRGIVSKH